ncbi:leucine--tRNA ligase [Candidatus Saccharibacteria bacterium]|nr:leucine--tRNA ligase [Candidatus Saccharibacteria bacterium]
MKRYNPSEVEPKWQKIWSNSSTHTAEDFSDRPKFTILTEFPYPSGTGLHMGHLREYTLGDIIARYKRANGFNVLFPMGYDAFGLPTENFAIKNKISPQIATKQNTANMRRQFDAMGCSIDWNRSFSTTDPEFYRWTQWMFLQFYRAGLAYQDEIAINWCPFCKTGLANEEVINGRHERCENLVEKKMLKQWMLRITDYAERLIDGLENVDYPARIADQQINWVGRSEGAEIDFVIASEATTAPVSSETGAGQEQSSQKTTLDPSPLSEKVVRDDNLIKVFTTRPDTIFGATFMVLAPEHPLVQKITTLEQKDEVGTYIRAVEGKSEIERQETDREKTGVPTGAYAINPATNEKIPIWIADYVLMGYGTGAIMAVPAHDERDYEFATKFNLPITEVVSGGDITKTAYLDEGTMVNSGEFNGLNSTEASKTITNWLIERGVAKRKTQYKLRDWVYSRQRYWGEPIPIIHCDKCGAVPVPEKDLPVELPAVEHYEPTDDGESPLSRIESWVKTTCPKCGKPAKRETDTMPNWAGSNWYYLRYYDAHNDKVFADPEKLKYWDMVDLYLGGMEHTTLHLLYSRFHHQFLYDQGLVPTPEPYAARRGQGIILAADGRKMSKSLGNVVDPTEIINSGYGADAARLGVTFLAPYDQTTPWSPEAVAGCYRFLTRVWNLTQQVKEKPAIKADDELLRAEHRTIKKITDDLDKMNFNTAIAGLMEYLNVLSKNPAKVSRANLETLLELLAPFAPHIASELYEQLGNQNSIETTDWPRYDENYLTDSQMTIAVQVNGKLRGEITVDTDAAQPDIERAALALDNVAKFTNDEIPAKIIYVPEKIINIVVKS